MNVGLLAPRFASHFDGVGDHAARVAEALSERGIDVVVFSEDATAQASCDVVPVGHWGAGAFNRIARFVRERAIELVLLEYTPFNFGPRTLVPHVLAGSLKARGVAVGTFLHEGFYRADGTNPMHPLRAALLGARDAAVVAASHAVFVASEARRAPVVTAVPWADRRVHVVPIGANVEPAPGWRWTPPAGPPYALIAFGVVVPRRRLELWIEAIALAAEFGIDFELTVVGRVYDEPYAIRCTELAHERGGGRRVRFARNRSPRDVSDLFARAHLAVTALYEGAIASSGSLLAALAHGVPLVAVETPRDEPAFHEVVTFARHDAAALLAAALRIIRPPDGGRAIGARARTHYARHFGWDQIAARALDATLLGAVRTHHARC
jgi:glycosyltransferase involved in cell wall biosynthesis